MIMADDGVVKLGGVLLPGLFKSLDIAGKAIVEEIEVEGKGKKPKQAVGYEDHTISIEIRLLDDVEGLTKEDKLAVLQNLFRQKGQRVPRVYDMVNRHTAQRGISKVIFESMGSKENNKKDELTVSLRFLEYETIQVSAKKSTVKGNSGNSNMLQQPVNVSNDYENYLQTGRGVAPKVQDKTLGSPAFDMPIPMIK